MTIDANDASRPVRCGPVRRGAGLPPSLKLRARMGRSHVVLALLLSIASATPVIVSLAYPEARLSRALFDISDPKSPRYGRHLNNEQLAALIAIPHATVSAVRAHLRELGCTAVTGNGFSLQWHVHMDRAHALRPR